jgi:glycosyltransferase involved in cell wall biosynthesis
MNKSKTLIVTPVYNAEEFMKRTLDSCLNQTLQTEIWIVDNCSTDNTQDIVKEYEEKDSRVKLIVNDKNYGRVGNWNKCLDLFMKSDYEYIKFVFSGDEILPMCIEEGEKAFAIDDEIGAIAFPYEFVHLDGTVAISRHGKYSNKLFTSKEITYKNLTDGGLLGAIICNTYAKRAIKDFRFDENAISKKKFDIEIFENSKAYYLDKVLAKFNLDAHRTFNYADSSFGYLEFAFIDSKEFMRIAKTDKFSCEENKRIEQRIILKCINDQLKYMSISVGIHIVKRILLNIIKKIIKRIIYGK